MSEKKLTVAELMARAAQQKGTEDASAPRKRRRRSLEEGGVSVAELTGSLPAVKDKPSDSRHTAQPIDDEDGATRISASELAARKGTSAPVTGPMDAEPQQGAHEAPHVSAHGFDDDDDIDSGVTAPDSVSTTTGQDESADTTAADIPGTDGTITAGTPSDTGTGTDIDTSADTVTGTDTDTVTAPAVETTAAQAAGTATASKSDTATATPDTAAVAEDKEDVATSSTPVEEKEEKPAADTAAAAAATGVAEEKQASASAPAGEKKPDDGVSLLAKAAAAAEAQRLGAKEPKADAPTAQTADGKAGEASSGLKMNVVDEKDPVQLTTGSFPAVVPEKQDAAAQTQPSGDNTPGVETGSAAASDKDTAEAEEHTEAAKTDDTVNPVADAMSPATEDKAVATVDESAPVKEDADTDSDDDDDDDEGGKRSTMSVVIMVIIALVLAVLIFKGFEILWLSGLNVWIKAILAFAVTLGCVGGVHALRTERDTLSMGLAALAGLAVTFGPLAVVAM